MPRKNIKSAKKYQITAISDALTDIIMEVEDADLQALHLSKGNSIELTPSNLRTLQKIARRRQPTISPGGSPTNVIYGASNLGLSCAFLGCVGSDDYGYDYINNLRENDIDTYVSIKKGKSGLCYTLISPDGERTFGLDFGVAKELHDYEILHSLIADSEFLHFSAYEFRGDKPLNHATRHATTIARKKGTRLSFDLGDSFVIDSIRPTLLAFLRERVDLLFANEDEARTLIRSDDYRKLLKYADLVVIKKGAQGSLALTPTEEVAVPAYRVDDVKDTNGAGDNFQAGFFYGLFKGLPLATCLKIGNFLAANIIRRIGAQSQVKIQGIEFII
ncbi:MAG: Fructokinase [Candidatus Ozemobacter sibiricus]|jgi:sugar/nucleoside kinase (ribokinase family)|uniref:Fructokinase n=1 Tax=Candidatus Ozemobacter sibiricus TaxID=2268124 RepID=A0A367ZQK4_9BACT|nr:MAG: Fructokinase [Candidatus Ozemobacter sibiricus]